MKLTRQKLRGLILESINESFEKGIMTTGFFGSMRGVSKDDISNFADSVKEKLNNSFGYVNEIDKLVNYLNQMHPAEFKTSKADFFKFANRVLSGSNLTNIYDIKNNTLGYFADFYKKAFPENSEAYMDNITNLISRLSIALESKRDKDSDDADALERIRKHKEKYQDAAFSPLPALSDSEKVELIKDYIVANKKNFSKEYPWNILYNWEQSTKNQPWKFKKLLKDHGYDFDLIAYYAESGLNKDLEHHGKI